MRSIHDGSRWATPPITSCVETSVDGFSPSVALLAAARFTAAHDPEMRLPSIATRAAGSSTCTP